jgi:hypothetical protein
LYSVALLNPKKSPSGTLPEGLGKIEIACWQAQMFSTGRLMTGTLVNR